MLPKLCTGMYQIKNIVFFFFFFFLFNRTELQCDVNFNRSTQKNENVNSKKVHAQREGFHSHSLYSKYQEVKYLY